MQKSKIKNQNCGRFYQRGFIDFGLLAIGALIVTAVIIPLVSSRLVSERVVTQERAGSSGVFSCGFTDWFTDEDACLWSNVAITGYSCQASDQSALGCTERLPSSEWRRTVCTPCTGECGLDGKCISGGIPTLTPTPDYDSTCTITRNSDCAGQAIPDFIAQCRGTTDFSRMINFACPVACAAGSRCQVGVTCTYSLPNNGSCSQTTAPHCVLDTACPAVPTATPTIGLETCSTGWLSSSDGYCAGQNVDYVCQTDNASDYVWRCRKNGNSDGGCWCSQTSEIIPTPTPALPPNCPDSCRTNSNCASCGTGWWCRTIVGDDRICVPPVPTATPVATVTPVPTATPVVQAGPTEKLWCNSAVQRCDQAMCLDCRFQTNSPGAGYVDCTGSAAAEACGSGGGVNCSIQPTVEKVVLYSPNGTKMGLKVSWKHVSWANYYKLQRTDNPAIAASPNNSGELVNGGNGFYYDQPDGINFTKEVIGGVAYYNYYDYTQDTKRVWYYNIKGYESNENANPCTGTWSVWKIGQANKVCSVTYDAVKKLVTMQAKGSNMSGIDSARLWVERSDWAGIVPAPVAPYVDPSGKYFYQLNSCNSVNGVECANTFSTASLPAGEYYFHCDMPTEPNKCTGSPNCAFKDCLADGWYRCNPGPGVFDYTKVTISGSGPTMTPPPAGDKKCSITYELLGSQTGIFQLSVNGSDGNAYGSAGWDLVTFIERKDHGRMSPVPQGFIEKTSTGAANAGTYYYYEIDKRNYPPTGLSVGYIREVTNLPEGDYYAHCSIPATATDSRQCSGNPFCTVNGNNPGAFDCGAAARSCSGGDWVPFKLANITLIPTNTPTVTPKPTATAPAGATLTPTPTPISVCNTYLSGDLNCDGKINGLDLGEMLYQWDVIGGSHRVSGQQWLDADIDKSDGTKRVNEKDIKIVINNWLP